MGKMLVLLVVAMASLFGAINLSTVGKTRDIAHNATGYYDQMRAKNLADSGVEIAIMHLYQDTLWSGLSDLSLGGGTLDISVNNTLSLYPDGADMGQKGKEITSIGQVGEQSVTVKSVVRIPITQVAPPLFNYALACDGDLNLSGNVKVRGDSGSLINANVHTNRNMSVNGDVDVRGFGTYSGELLLSPDDENRFFNPQDNSASLPVTIKIPRVAIPQFDANSYAEIATNVFSTDVTLSGDISLGDHEHPQIWYIDGDLHLSGSISGYGVFIVTGSIYITGNTVITAMDPISNNLGLYAFNDIDIAGNVQVEAQVFAGDDVIMRGNNTLTGLASAGDKIDIQGDVDIYYRPVNKNLTTPIWNVKQVLRPVMVSYY